MKIFISPRSRLATLLPVIAALLFVFPQRALSAAPVTPTISSVTESTNAAYGAGTLTVNWNAVSGATSYAAMITKQGTSETPTVITNEDSTNLQATFRNLPGGTTYIVQVKAFTGVESSPWSSATRTAIPKTFPKAPAKPTVVKGIGRATVSWTALTASEKGGYEVTSYLVTELNSSKTVTATGTSTEAIVTGLTNGATVEFTVAAITAAGAAGSTSDKSDKYILDDVPSTPSAPVLTTTDTSGEVKATWTAPTNDNGSSLISYTIKLFKDGIERTSEIITKIADTFYTFTSLLNGTYTSKVLATNGVGDSALSVFSNQIVIGSSASPTPTPSPTSSASPSATPSASPSASPSPSPSPTETSAPAPPSFGGGFGGGGGGGFGGGFGGGGALPDAVVPLVTPSPIPSPTITPSAPAQIVPTLAPTSTARPSAIPTPSKPTPSGSVTPRPIPSPTQLPKIKSNSFIAPVQITTTTQRVVATSIKMTQNIKAGKSLSVTLPPVKKGTNVTVNVKTPDGKVIAIKTETLKKSGSYTLPALAFKKTGTYQVIVKIGSKFKTVTVKVAK